MIFFTNRVHVRKAKRKPVRQKTKTYKRLTALSNTMANSTRIDLIKGIRRFKMRVGLDSLEEAWKTTSWGNLMRVIPWGKLPEDLSAARARVGETWQKASLISAEKLPPNVRDNLRFDIKNPRIANFMNTRTGNMVVNIQADTQNIIQNAVARSFSNALTPRDVASSIRNSIGLFPGQQTALMNYRQGLKESGMKPDRVDAFSSKYEDRLLDYRAKMIARTETRQATNQGQLFIWQDAQNQDLIAPTAKKVWVVDGAPCEICEPMDGVAIGLAESWTLPNGDIADIPTDAHPHCFCGMELEFGTEDRPQAEEYNHGYEDQE